MCVVECLPSLSGKANDPVPFLNKLSVLHIFWWHLCHMPVHMCVYVSFLCLDQSDPTMWLMSRMSYVCYNHFLIIFHFLNCHYFSILSTFKSSICFAESNYRILWKKIWNWVFCLDFMCHFDTTDNFRMLIFSPMNIKVDH